MDYIFLTVVEKVLLALEVATEVNFSGLLTLQERQESYSQSLKTG